MSNNLGQAHIDPLKLQEFAAQLSLFAEKITELDRALEHGLMRLGQTFRDDEYQRFRARFTASRSRLAAFVEEVRETVPKLNADADDIRAAQNVRLDI